MRLDVFQDAVFFATIRITAQSENGKGDSIGTGFIFQVPLNDEKNRAINLLISNRHVFGDPSRSILMNFHMGDDAVGPKLGDTITFTLNGSKYWYMEHPDKNVDLACINISNLIKSENNIFYKNLYKDIIYDFSEDGLLPGQEIWFVGYPENRFDVTNNLPILRKGFIASIPSIDFNGKKQFVIDAQVFPGSSGSPVFAVSGSKFKLIGVVSQTMIKNQELQTIPTGSNFRIQQIIGLGLVIKSNLVREFIDIVTHQFKLMLEKEERRSDVS